MEAHLQHRLRARETRQVLVEDEGQDLPLPRRVALVELADEDDGVRIRPVGDEGLAAVQHVAAVAVAAGGRLHAAEGVGARAGLGDGPRADRLERQEGKRPALLLAEGAARHDGGGGEADAHAERGHHAGAVAAELDHGDQLHGCRVGRLGTGGALARARLAFLLARDLPLEPCARHLVDAEGRHELPEDRVGRRVAVLELAQVRLDLGLDEAAKGLADQLVLLAPLDHDGLPNSARVFRSMWSRLFSAISAVSRRRSTHWSAVDSALATGSWPAGARSR